MPQLDIGSYRTQVNALVRTFGVRYRTRAGFGLPKVARAIKRRSRKTERGRSQGESGTIQKNQAEDAYGKELGGGLLAASDVLNTSRDMHGQWRSTHILSHRKSVSEVGKTHTVASKKDLRTKRMGLIVSDEADVEATTSKKTLAKLKGVKNKRRKSLKMRRKQVADMFKALTNGKPKKMIKASAVTKKAKSVNQADKAIAPKSLKEVIADMKAAETATKATKAKPKTSKAEPKTAKVEPKTSRAKTVNTKVSKGTTSENTKGTSSSSSSKSKSKKK